MFVLVHNTRTDFYALSERAAQYRLGFVYKFLRRIYPPFCFLLSVPYLVFLIHSWRTLSPLALGYGIYTTAFLLNASCLWTTSFALSFFVSKRKKRFGVPFNLELGQDGLHIEQAGKQSFVSWSEFHYVSHDAHHLFFLRNGRTAQSLVIPNRSFSSADQSHSFSSTAFDFWLQANCSRPPIAAP